MSRELLDRSISVSEVVREAIETFGVTEAEIRGGLPRRGSLERRLRTYEARAHVVSRARSLGLSNAAIARSLGAGASFVRDLERRCPIPQVTA